MKNIKEMLGVSPQLKEENAYIPSAVSLKMATKKETSYEPDENKSILKNQGSILVLCTEEKYMTMKNGKRFITGNHPVELFVPLLHLRDAGYTFKFITISGKPVSLEMWAFPEKDKAVKEIYNATSEQLNNPYSLNNEVSNIENFLQDIDGLFIPGGHGAMLGLPFDTNVGELLITAKKLDKHIFAICHGPAAFLATGIKNEFIFKNYEMVLFPDKVDKTLPQLGYLPGDLIWHFEKALKDKGASIVNTLATGSCHEDRKLITGDSPLAANKFGKLVVKAMQKSVTDTV